MSDLAALLARIEAAEGPDREIDMHLSALEAGIALEQVGNEFLSPDDEVVGSIDPGVSARNFRLWNRFERDVLHYTSSLDAAVSLCERCGYRIYTVDAPTPISGYTVMLVSIEKRRLNAELGHDDIGWLYVGASHAAFPLALCAAVVKAKMEEEKP